MPDIVVSEVAATAIATAINAQTAANATAHAAQLAYLEKLFGSVATVSTPGGITAQMANTVLAVNDVRNQLAAQASSAKTMELAIGNLSKSIDTQTKALAGLQYTMMQALNTMQIATVDQMKANKHQQMVVADSRAEQGKADIIIKEEDSQAAIIEGIKQQTELKKQVFLSGSLDTFITDGFAQGKIIATKWFVDSGIEDWVKNQWLTLKGQVTALYADKKVQEVTNTTAISAAQQVNDPKIVPSKPVVT